MTMYRDRKETCSECGAATDHADLLSTNQMEPGDLDGRPGEMARSTLGVQVVCCHHCQRCGTSLATPLGENARRHLGSAAYRAGLADPELPLLARQFRAAAELAAAERNWSLHAGHLLHAAWVCDDARNQRAAAAPLRVQAARAFALALLDEPDASLSRRVSCLALQVDLLRRAGHFDAAAQCLQLAPDDDDEQVPEPLRDALHLQRLAVQRGDPARFTTADARSASPRSARYAAQAAQEQAARAAARQERLDRERELTLSQSPPACATALARLLRDGWSPPAWAPAAATATVLTLLPLPPSMSAILAAHAKAGNWPARPLLGALGLALRRVLPEPVLGPAEDQRLFAEAAEAHGALVDYLTQVLRSCDAEEWHHNPPLQGPGGLPRPLYGPDGTRV